MTHGLALSLYVGASCGVRPAGFLHSLLHPDAWLLDVDARAGSSGSTRTRTSCRTSVRTSPGTAAEVPAPRVVAHRGASDEAPEHTLAAYQRAIEAGADGLECDVRMTRDGVLVCVHDRTVDRTSDGRGAVAALALADLEQLDFSVRRRRVLARTAPGSWRAAAPALDEVGVLTLERLLALVASAPRRVELAIETKYPTRYAGRLEEELCAAAGPGRACSGRQDAPVRVMSFASASLRRVHALAPELPTVLLLRRLSARLRDGALPDPVTRGRPVRRAGATQPVVRPQGARRRPRGARLDRRQRRGRRPDGFSRASTR